MGVLQPLPAETFSLAWCRLHRDSAFAVSASELHYWRTLAVALDDDLASLLLLKKLRRAAELPPAELPRDLVVMGSIVEFAFDGGARRVGQLVHPSACRTDAQVAADSSLGAGLIGLSAGQAILWPNADGFLRQLEVHRVEPARGPNLAWARRDDGGGDPPPRAA